MKRPHPPDRHLNIIVQLPPAIVGFEFAAAGTFSSQEKAGVTDCHVGQWPPRNDMRLTGCNDTSCFSAHDSPFTALFSFVRKPPVLVGFEHRGKSKEEWQQIYRGIIPTMTAKIMQAMENTHT